MQIGVIALSCASCCIVIEQSRALYAQNLDDGRLFTGHVFSSFMTVIGIHDSSRQNIVRFMNLRDLRWSPGGEFLLAFNKNSKDFRICRSNLTCAPSMLTEDSDCKFAVDSNGLLFLGNSSFSEIRASSLAGKH
jgi:hypothetical protein